MTEASGFSVVSAIATATGTLGRNDASGVTVSTFYIDATGTVQTYTPPSVTSGRLNLDIDVLADLTAYPGSYGAYDPAGYRPQYRVDILEPGGLTRICTMDKAIIGNITWELDNLGSATFTVPLNDPKINNISVPDREVQIWMGSDLLWSGVIVRAQATPSVVEFQCMGLSWYFTKRTVGRENVNYLVNGSFEGGMTGWQFAKWSDVEPSISGGWEVQIFGDQGIVGDHALYQYSDDTNVYGIRSYQDFTQDVFEAYEPEGCIWTVSAWCFIPDGLWIGPRSGPRVRTSDDEIVGLKFSIYHEYDGVLPTEVLDAPGIGNTTVLKPTQEINMAIGNDVPRNTWVRLEASIKQAINTRCKIRVSLGTPIGGIFWDEVRVVKNERLCYKQIDQATLVGYLVQHAQDPAMNKGSVNIGTNCPATGVLRQRTYEYSERPNVMDSIQEFPDLFNGVDWSIVDDGSGTRTFTTHYPMRGAQKANQALVLDKNIADVSMVIDGDTTANSVTVSADGGEGASREEATAIDPSTLTNGLVLEKVYNATPGSAIYTLQAQAQRGLTRYSRPVVMATVSTYEVQGSELLGLLNPGDIVPVRVNRGWIQLNGEYRIVTITLDPNTGILSYGINPYVDIALSGHGNIPPDYGKQRDDLVREIDKVADAKPAGLGVTSNPGFNPDFGGSYPSANDFGFTPNPTAAFESLAGENDFITRADWNEWTATHNYDYHFSEWELVELESGWHTDDTAQPLRYRFEGSRYQRLIRILGRVRRTTGIGGQVGSIRQPLLTAPDIYGNAVFDDIQMPVVYSAGGREVAGDQNITQFFAAIHTGAGYMRVTASGLVFLHPSYPLQSIVPAGYTRGQLPGWLTLEDVAGGSPPSDNPVNHDWQHGGLQNLFAYSFEEMYSDFTYQVNVTYPLENFRGNGPFVSEDEF